MVLLTGLTPGLLPAVAQEAPVRVEHRLGAEGPTSQSVTFVALGLPLPILRDLPGGDPTSESRWSSVFRVHVESEVQPAMLGTYRMEGDTLTFEPSFPLRFGLRYVAVLDGNGLSQLLGTSASRPTLRYTLSLAAPERLPTTSVDALFPSGDVLPENLLRLYLHFSAAMKQGSSYQHVHLVDAHERRVEDAFVELEHELWNPQGTRLTLLFDPGRLKRGLRPQREIGSALEAQHDFTLVVDDKWRDVFDRPLTKTFRRSFSVASPDRESPRPQHWEIRAPLCRGKGAARDPFP